MIMLDPTSIQMSRIPQPRRYNFIRLPNKYYMVEDIATHRSNRKTAIITYLYIYLAIEKLLLLHE